MQQTLTTNTSCSTTPRATTLTAQRKPERSRCTTPTTIASCAPAPDPIFFDILSPPNLRSLSRRGSFRGKPTWSACRPSLGRRKLERSRPGRPPPPRVRRARISLEATADPNLIPLGARLRASRAGWRRRATRAAAVLDEVPDSSGGGRVLILRNGSYDDVSDGRWDIKPRRSPCTWSTRCR